MTFYHISREVYKVCENSLAGAYMGAGIGFLAGCIVKPCISGFDHLQCIKIASIFFGIVGVITSFSEESSLIRMVVALGAGVSCSIAFAKLQGIPFAPWTCVAVGIASITIILFLFLGSNYFRTLNSITK